MRDLLLEKIFNYSAQNVFNPYKDVCQTHDNDQSPILRQKNLELFLEKSLSNKTKTIWIGRDLGYKGGRRTGIALTDEFHLLDLSRKIGATLQKSTITNQIREKTASTIWEILNNIKEPVFLWNVFPFHPHDAGNPLSNRLHTKQEQDFGIEILNQIIAYLNIKQIIAIGNDAYSISDRISGKIERIEHVRHPSYGGKTDFIRKMSNIYGISTLQNQLKLFDG